MVGLVRQRWLQVAVAAALIGCICPDLDDDDPVLYGQGLPDRDQHESLYAVHGMDCVRIDSLSQREPVDSPLALSHRWPAPAEQGSPEQPDLSPERPPPRRLA